MLQKRLFVLCLVAAICRAGTYYVSPNGLPENDGSSSRPWPSVQFALEKVGGGHTIILKAGVYAGRIFLAKTVSGTQNSPTVIQSEEKWKAQIVGSSTHGVYTADGTDWVVIDGLEVLGTLLDGIKLSGDNAVVRNCWVHGAGAMGVSIHGKKNWTIERNLIEFNGLNPQFHHGIYADGDRYMIRDNIVRHNAGYGMQVYPNASNGYILNNLIYGQGRKAGLVLQSPKGGGHNVVANNTVADNAGGGVNLYNADSEIVISNVIAAATPIMMNPPTKNAWFANNLCQPECGVDGDNFTGDAQFVSPSRGVYYLSPSSPAVGAGRPELSPQQDFWGRTRSNDVHPDLGAFPFVPYLATDASRAPWYSGYAYRYSTNKGQDMPDLWILPTEAAAAVSTPHPNDSPAADRVVSRLR